MAARPSGSVDYTQWMRGRGRTTFNVQQLQQSVRTSRVYLSPVNPHACVVRAASRSAALFGATCESPSRLVHPFPSSLGVCDPAILVALSTPPPLSSPLSASPSHCCDPRRSHLWRHLPVLGRYGLGELPNMEPRLLSVAC